MQRCSVLDCLPILYYYLIIVGFNTYSFHSSWRSQDWSPRGLGGRHPGVSPGPCPSSLAPWLAPAQVMVTTASYRPNHDQDGSLPRSGPGSGETKVSPLLWCGGCRGRAVPVATLSRRRRGPGHASRSQILVDFMNTLKAKNILQWIVKGSQTLPYLNKWHSFHFFS